MFLSLQRSVPSLSQDDILDCWSETILAIIDAAKERRIDLGRGSLRPFIWAIAKNKAMTLLRKRLQSVLTDLHDTLPAKSWSSLDELERHEVEQVVATAVKEELTHQEQGVWGDIQTPLSD